MIRTDGQFIIYMIQHYTERSDHVRNDRNRWTYSNFDHFWTPHVTGHRTGQTAALHLATTDALNTNGFSACGDCWQTTGIRGTFDRTAALEGLAWISKKWPEYQFRLVKVELSQKTSVEKTMRRKKAA